MRGVKSIFIFIAIILLVSGCRKEEQLDWNIIGGAEQGMVFIKDCNNPYNIDKYEVTVSGYEECVKNGECLAPDPDLKECNWGKEERKDHPINCVSWKMANAYCRWAGKRLPSDFEWEKASGVEKGFTYPWGNEFNCAYSRNSVVPCKSSSTTPVGSYMNDKSPYGAMDMSGNVSEWVSEAKILGNRTLKLVKGGNYLVKDESKLISKASEEKISNYSFSTVGFRCAK